MYIESSKCEDALDQLDSWNDAIVNTVSNTYLLKGASTFILVDGIGYVNHRDLDIKEVCDEDDEEFESVKCTRSCH